MDTRTSWGVFVEEVGLKTGRSWMGGKKLSFPGLSGMGKGREETSSIWQNKGKQWICQIWKLV